MISAILNPRDVSPHFTSLGSISCFSTLQKLQDWLLHTMRLSLRHAFLQGRPLTRAASESFQIRVLPPEHGPWSLCYDKCAGAPVRACKGCYKGNTKQGFSWKGQVLCCVAEPLPHIRYKYCRLWETLLRLMWIMLDSGWASRPRSCTVDSVGFVSL